MAHLDDKVPVFIDEANVTKDERDVWVSAFAWACAFGSRRDACFAWADKAVRMLRNGRFGEDLNAR